MRYFMALFAALGLINSCNAEPLPRLLLAERSGKFAFFLPISHHGVDDEVDEYLDRVIAPTFRASTLVLAEAASLSVPRTEWSVPCEDRTSDVLDTQTWGKYKRQVVGSPLSPVYLPRGSPPSSFETLMLMLTSPGATEQEGVPPVWGALWAGSGIKLVSIEDSLTFRQAFCSTTPSAREQVLDYFSAVLAGESPPDPEPQSYREAVVMLREQFKEDHRPTMPREAALQEPGNAAFKFLVAGRSLAWMSSIEKTAMDTELPFYVLGAAHFLDTAFGKGIPSLLEERGYRVKLVTAIDDLPPTLKARIESHSNDKPLDLSNALRAGTAENAVSIRGLGSIIGPVSTIATAPESNCQSLPAGAHYCSYSFADGSLVTEAIEASGARMMTRCSGATSVGPPVCVTFRLPQVPK